MLSAGRAGLEEEDAFATERAQSVHSQNMHFDP